MKLKETWLPTYAKNFYYHMVDLNKQALYVIIVHRYIFKQIGQILQACSKVFIHYSHHVEIQTKLSRLV